MTEPCIKKGPAKIMCGEKISLQHVIGGRRRISCMRPKGHDGLHLGVNIFGDYISWNVQKICINGNNKNQPVLQGRVSDREGRWLSNAVLSNCVLHSPEWLKRGQEYYDQLSPEEKKKTRWHFCCNVYNGTYILAPTGHEACALYSEKFFLPSEGFAIYGRIIGTSGN